MNTFTHYDYRHDIHYNVTYEPAATSVADAVIGIIQRIGFSESVTTLTDVPPFVRAAIEEQLTRLLCRKP